MSQLVADNLIHLKIVEGENLYFYRGIIFALLKYMFNISLELTLKM